MKSRRNVRQFRDKSECRRVTTTPRVQNFLSAEPLRLADHTDSVSDDGIVKRGVRGSGEEVRKGQVLATLDDVDMQNFVTTASAKYTRHGILRPAKDRT